MKTKKLYFQTTKNQLEKAKSHPTDHEELDAEVESTECRSEDL